MKDKIETSLAPAAIGPYSQGIKANGFVFVSGQLPVEAKTGMMPSDIKQQTAQALENIKEILKAANLEMADIVKTTVYLQHITDFAAMNEVYASFFKTDCPARACYEVVALPKGALVEIEAIALCNS